MAKFKLPEPLKSWKVIQRLDDVNDNAVYRVSKKEIDGSITNAVLTQITYQGESYNDDNIDYLLNESDFIQSIIDIGRVSNYLAVATNENERKQKFDLFIVTEDIPTLSSVLQGKKMDEDEIVDFGIQMSEILEKLEENKIFHGNIKPENIYVTPHNRYKLGGFIDAESKVNDLTYVAPEIQRNEKADYTTDIYSTGLVMYAMDNEGLLPFEDSDVTPKEAMVKRFEGETVPAPQNGSEKLKSVIVIACQPESKNRWKNAGNLKNALNSIKSEKKEDEEPKENVIVPETTDFEENVFEDGNAKSDDTENDSVDKAETAAALGAGIAAGAVAAGAGIIAADAAGKDASAEIPETGDTSVEAPELSDTPAKAVEETKTPSDIEQLEAELDSKTDPGLSDNNSPADNDNYEIIDNTNIDAPADNEIDNRVFDNYQTKVFNLNEAISSGEKDYGDYFDEPDPEPEPQPESEAPEQQAKPVEFEDYTVFDDRNDPDAQKKKKSRKGLVAGIIIGIVVLLALIATFLYFAFQKGMFGGFNPFDNTQTTSATEEASVQSTTAGTTKQQSTTQPTTVAPTTQKPTDASAKSLIRVIGEPLETAKQMLEAEGYNVVIGEYYYDDFYYEGNVVSQYPEAYTEVEPGSTITLNISLGPEKKQSSQSSEEDEDDNNNNNNDSSGSGYSYSNSSYLSEDTVKNMSSSEVNLAINEIYARHGRIFTDPELDAYFRSKDWYTPKYTADEFDVGVFNEYEVYNFNLLGRYR